MEHLTLSTLISEAKIQTRIQELGTSIKEKLDGKEVIAVGVLKGSIMFYADLLRNIDMDIKCEFYGCSSYGNSTKSSGEVKLTMDINSSIKDKHILLIEDIVDTGLTMNYLKSVLKARKPASITTASLLIKPDCLKEPCEVDFTGFEIGNEFVVGFGLDFQGFYRNLPYIATVNMN
ncbi:MAG: hypoxanthine phosphoribosyltransferase [Bdellovibrionales bacterium]